ncbi:hypothetical protein EYF80_020102 [Liparis tanakae]|uniref:Uncharacterized protein n=1 Tax=Liparis tanakae TaxID=230148 RepID=A0A4Z2HVN6_9TELE|nr:hypothetical protein EYF80_020102 [Liparis tanakae]
MPRLNGSLQLQRPAADVQVFDLGAIKSLIKISQRGLWIIEKEEEEEEEKEVLPGCHRMSGVPSCRCSSFWAEAGPACGRTGLPCHCRNHVAPCSTESARSTLPRRALSEERHPFSLQTDNYESCGAACECLESESCGPSALSAHRGVLNAGLLLTSMDHVNGNSHTDDESDGNETSKNPDNATRGTLRHWLLCRQEEK